jgi:hypothetical protein
VERESIVREASHEDTGISKVISVLAGMEEMSQMLKLTFQRPAVPWFFQEKRTNG